MAETSSNKRPRPNGSDADTCIDPGPKRQAIRKRAPLACEECRGRKRRCDGAVPICGGCAKRMSSCVYLADIQEKAWHHDMIQSLRNRLRELEHWTGQQAEQRVHTAHNADMAHENAQPDLNGRFATGVQEQECCSGAEDSIVVADQPQAQSRLINPSVTPRAVAASPPPASLELNTDNPSINHQLPDITCVSMQSPMVATTYASPPGSSGRIEPNSVERLMRPIDQAIVQTSCHSIGTGPAPVRVVAPYSLPCSCNRLLGAGHWSLPIRRQADDLVHLYFSRVHRIYPILHQPTFMKQYKLLWEPAPTESSIPAHCSGLCKQKSLDKTFPATVNAVFALASLFGPRPMAQNSARAGSFFNTTQQIDLLDIIDEEVGIELVQLLLLMGYYLQSTERFSKCWNITGLAIRMAQNMGLQLSPSDARRKGLLAACPTQLESEMRIRVWYGCVLLDREISMSFGRPLMINTTGSEQLKLPEAIDDEHLSDVVGGKWNSQPSNCPSLLESYIQTIKLYGILGQVLDREELKDGMTTPSRLAHPDKQSRVNSDTQSLLDLDTMIMEWRDSLPASLQYDPSVDVSRQGRALTPDSIPQTDFSAQAKRLHARFLHVRVLILRPALDHLFHKQRDLHLSEGKASSPRVTRIQDLMLSDIASQCVLSADSLVRCLDAHIRSQSLVAWWYNIGYLHTCGSTLLMGRLCTFNDAVLKQTSLAVSWDLCLQSLSRYTGLSSIADKSVHLLQGSLGRLLPEREKDQAVSIPEPGRSSEAQPVANLPTGFPDGTAAAVDTTVAAPADGSSRPAEIQFTSLPEITSVSERLPDMFSAPIMGLESSLQLEEGLDAEVWSANDSGTTYWPFMPYLSQLESLPHDFDVAKMQ